MSIMIEIPVHTVNEANHRRHWRGRQRRAKEQRGVTHMTLRQHKPPRWDAYTVRLTRIAPRRLDDDGAVASLKACRDGVADYLGIDDGDPRIRWLYSQERGAPKSYSVRVEISKRDPHVCPACGQRTPEAA